MSVHTEYFPVMLITIRVEFLKPSLGHIWTDVNYSDYHWSLLNLFNRYFDGETTTSLIQTECGCDAGRGHDRGHVQADTAAPTRQ